jgi:hypothetical protein
MITRDGNGAESAMTLPFAADMAHVDESFIIARRDQNARALPTFQYPEITLGKVLGTGGFGIVYEITKFTTKGRPLSENVAEGPGVVVPHEGCDQHESPSTNIPQDAQQVNDKSVEMQNHQTSSMRSVSSDVVYSHSNLHIHCNVHKAKDWMQKCCSLTSSEVVSSRYALKRLQKGLTTIERARGMLDLANEAKYLSIVWHPNIGTLTLFRCE